MRALFLSAALMGGLVAVTGNTFAADSAPVLALRNNQFEPKELTVPEGVKVRLIVRNTDSAPAEFESYDLSREVVVAAQSDATIYIGPLQPGRYRFFNDFNRATEGWVVVKPAAPEKK